MAYCRCQLAVRRNTGQSFPSSLDGIFRFALYPPIRYGATRTINNAQDHEPPRLLDNPSIKTHRMQRPSISKDVLLDTYSGI